MPHGARVVAGDEQHDGVLEGRLAVGVEVVRAPGPRGLAEVAARVARIAPRVTALLERAAQEGRSPAVVADEMAEEVIAAGAQRAAA